MDLFQHAEIERDRGMVRAALHAAETHERWNERAYAFTAFLNRLHADANASGDAGGHQFGLGRNFAEFVPFQMQHRAERMPFGENILHTAAQKFSRRRTEKLFRRGADHYRTRISRE